MIKSVMSWGIGQFMFSPFHKRSPAKGVRVRQKVSKKVIEASEKWQKGDQNEKLIDLLLPTSLCSTLEFLTPDYNYISELQEEFKSQKLHLQLHFNLPGIELVLCWVRAASGPFFGEQFISTKSGFKIAFCQWAEMGSEVGQKWVFGCKSGSKCVKTHFCTHFKPILAYSRKPTFYPV